ncbi:MAG: hypothetical protein H8E38_03365 [SAR324 cluster bacterium]|nr:hypothetical protein [SAR324 cluster bacterium]MBL7035488.1 hypothetical protein [SAR324 cluster bacterium]
MEKLKSQYESSIQEQVSALREARYISKHMGEPGKRELAIGALTFLAFTSDDGDIRDRSLSRLETVLESPDWPTHLKFSVIDNVVNLVSGDLGFQEKHDGLDMRFGVKYGIRKDALSFLLNQFEGLAPELQYHSVSALNRLLLTEPTLANCPENICDENVRKNQEEWDLGREVKNAIPDNADQTAVEAGAYGPATKRVPLDQREDWNEEMDNLKEVVWDWMEDPLEDLDSQFLIRGRLIRFAGEIENFYLQEEKENDFREQISTWAENEDISVDLRQLLGATREKVKLYGFPAEKSPVLAEKKYRGILEGSVNFVETHLDAVLHQQHERQRSGFDTGLPVPVETAFNSFDESPEDLLKREIMLENMTFALQKGLVLDTKKLTVRVLKAIERARTETELAPLLKMIGSLYSSIKLQKNNPRPLFEALVEKAEAAENLSLRRLYLDSILAGAAVFPEEANLRLAFASDQDVVTRHKIDSVLQNLNGTL